MSSICLYALFLVSAIESNHESARWQDPGRCGSNCLYVMLRLAGVNIKYEDVAKVVPVDPKVGSTALELCTASRNLGLELAPRQVSIDELHTISTPFILHVELADVGGTGHFLVVTNVAGAGPQLSVTYVDGTSANVVTTGLKRIESIFTGYILIPLSTKREFTPSLSVYSICIISASAAAPFALMLFWRTARSRGNGD